MTTFTTEDRILAEKDGSLTINVNGGSVTSSPPHIVDSGASVMNNEPVAWMSVDLDGRTVLATYEFETAIPLYTHPAKTLTDEEIITVLTNKFVKDQGRYASTNLFYIEFARAILKKASEK